MPSQIGDGDCHLEEAAKELYVMCVTEKLAVKDRKNTKTVNWQKVKGSLSAESDIKNFVACLRNLLPSYLSCLFVSRN